MAFKNFITDRLDQSEQLQEVRKNFDVPNDYISNTTRKVLQKFGFVVPIGLDFFDDLPVGVSPLGTLVMDSLNIPAGRYTVINTEGVQESIDYEGLIIETVTFEASQQKNIVKTEIAGREGAVKEYISSNDTAITIRGAVVNSLGIAYPRNEVLALTRILNVPQQIRVESKFINDILGFEFITIESWNLLTTPGLRNVQAFTITAINDVSPSIDEVYNELPIQL